MNFGAVLGTSLRSGYALPPRRTENGGLPHQPAEAPLIQTETVSRRSQPPHMVRHIDTTGALVSPANTSEAVAIITDNPDAALIALCAEYEALERQIHTIYDSPARATTDEEATAHAAPLEKNLGAMLGTLEAMQAQTAAGVHARVRLMAAHNGDGGFSWDGDGVAGRLLACALRDAVHIEAPQPQDPNAALIKARAGFEKKEAPMPW